MGSENMVTGILIFNTYSEDFFSADRYVAKLNQKLKFIKAYSEEVIIVSNVPELLLPHTPRNIRIITEYYKGKGVIGRLHAGLSLSSYPTNIVIHFDTLPDDINLPHVLNRFYLTKSDLILFDPSYLNGIYRKSIVPLLAHALEQESSTHNAFEKLN